MSFEIYIPSDPRANPLPIKECAVTKSGAFSFTAEAGRKIGLEPGGRVTVLIDRGTRRIALKRPTDEGRTMRLRAENRRVAVCIRGVLRELGLRPPDKPTRLPLEIKSSDGIVVANLGDLPEIH